MVGCRQLRRDHRSGLYPCSQLSRYGLESAFVESQSDALQQYEFAVHAVLNSFVCLFTSWSTYKYSSSCKTYKARFHWHPYEQFFHELEALDEMEISKDKTHNRSSTKDSFEMIFHIWLFPKDFSNVPLQHIIEIYTLVSKYLRLLLRQLISHNSCFRFLFIKFTRQFSRLEYFMTFCLSSVCQINPGVSNP